MSLHGPRQPISPAERHDAKPGETPPTLKQDTRSPFGGRIIPRPSAVGRTWSTLTGWVGRAEYALREVVSSRAPHAILPDLVREEFRALCNLNIPVRASDLDTLVAGIAPQQGPLQLDRITRLRHRLSAAADGTLTARELLRPIRRRGQAMTIYDDGWHELCADRWVIRFANSRKPYTLRETPARNTMTLGLSCGDPVMGLLGAIDHLRFRTIFNKHVEHFAALVPDWHKLGKARKMAIRKAWVQCEVQQAAFQHAKTLWHAGYWPGTPWANALGLANSRSYATIVTDVCETTPGLKNYNGLAAVRSAILANPLRIVRDRAERATPPK